MERCYKCKYYIPHYAMHEGKVYHIDGHCINFDERGRYRKTDKICECYKKQTPYKIKKDNYAYLAKVLDNVESQLAEINLYIKRYKIPKQ